MACKPEDRDVTKKRGKYYVLFCRMELPKFHIYFCYLNNSDFNIYRNDNTDKDSH
jgi:hypothetical protein